MPDPDTSLDVEALVFDAYGTLFDVHSVAGLAEALAPGRGPALSQLWRTKQLEYTWLREPDDRPDVGATGLRGGDGSRRSTSRCRRWRSISTPARAHVFRQRTSTSRRIPDVAATLSSLAPRPRWILSNGTLAMLEPLVRQSGLDAVLDGVLSVDAAGIYKPSPRVYQLAVDRLRLPPRRIGFVSSNCWDAVGAKAFGFTTFWINRAAAPVDRHGPAPDRIMGTLGDLPSLLRPMQPSALDAPGGRSTRALPCAARRAPSTASGSSASSGRVLAAVDLDHLAGDVA